MKTIAIKQLALGLCIALFGSVTVHAQGIAEFQGMGQKGDKSSDPRNRAKIHTELGALYFQDGNMAVAIDELRIALDADSSYYPAYSVRGLVHAYLKEYAKDVTIEHLKKGAGIPLAAGELPLPKIPSLIQSKLPTVGPLNFAQGRFNISLFTANDVTRSYKLVDAWPTSVTSIPLSNEAEGLMELTVSLTYKRWESKAGKVDNGMLGAVAGAAARFLR